MTFFSVDVLLRERQVLDSMRTRCLSERNRNDDVYLLFTSHEGLSSPILYLVINYNLQAHLFCINMYKRDAMMHKRWKHMHRPKHFPFKVPLILYHPNSKAIKEGN